LLADMDSTMIGQECIDELAAEIGKRAHVTAITGRAMRGEIAFEPALRERVTLLKGLDRATILRVIANKITLTPGGRALVQTMRANRAHTVLVSGGFSVFTSVIAERIGFHEHQANELLFGEDGRLSGRVAEPVLGQDAKLSALKQLREKHGLSVEDTLAWATAPTISRCSKPRVSALPFAPNPRSRPPPMRGSIMAISPRCFMRKATGARIFLQTRFSKRARPGSNA
jgi:phosphoserine phosphatase